MADAELDELEKQRSEIIHNLEILNAQVKRQNSLWRTLLIGVIYGIGFFIGSAIIATIAFGIFGPFIGQIPWIRDAFQTGASLLKQ